MKRLALLTLGAALLASPSFAADWDKSCGLGGPTSPGTADIVVSGNDRICYELAAADTAAGADSGQIEFVAESTFVLFDSDTTATTIGAGRIELRLLNRGIKVENSRCTTSTVPFACCTGADTGTCDPELESTPTGVLSGTGGAAAVQNAGDRYGPGVYYIDVTVNMDATGRVTIQAENVQAP